MLSVVACRKCEGDVEVSTLDRAEMLITGGWIEHTVCPKDLPQPNEPTMNLLHPERLGLFEGIASLFRRRRNRV